MAQAGSDRGGVSDQLTPLDNFLPNGSIPRMLGTSIAHYKITAKLGKGGMGEVYRATDTKLDREVAIKVLPESFAQDKERLARFEREAKTLATLNHPNIAGIYGLEKFNQSQALVLELIEGEDLSNRLAKGPLPVEEALDVCRQIAEALEAAHEKGIVHRDLKPGNVMLTADGHVKALDFGLAKAMTDEQELLSSAIQEDSPTITDVFTKPGTILGTAAYMSPEQARGKLVDKRSDIWAFGCILFECLTAQKAFQGEDATETLAGIIKGEPDWSKLPPGVPAVIQLSLRKCLAKRRRQRMQDIGDVRIDLEQALDNPAQLDLDQEKATESPGVHQRGWMRQAQFAVLLIIGLFIGLGISNWSAPNSQSIQKKEISRFYHRLPSEQFIGEVFREIAIAPNGRSFAYVLSDGIYLRNLGDLNAHKIPGSDGSARCPVFSPDSRHIAFLDKLQLKRLPVTGGTAKQICEATAFDVRWDIEEQIHFSLMFGKERNGIYKVSSSGGIPQLLIPASEEEYLSSFQILPGEESILFVSTQFDSIWRNIPWDESRIFVQKISGNERVEINAIGSGARYLTSGHLIFGFQGTLFGIPFDLDSLRCQGDPITLLTGQMKSRFAGIANYDVANDGTLIWLDSENQPSDDRNLVWVDKEGAKRAIPHLEERSYTNLNLSPDGKKAVVEIESETGEMSLWVVELDRGVIYKITDSETGGGKNPLWSPDGKRVVYSSREGDILQLWIRDADGTGDARLISKFDSPINDVRPWSWAAPETLIVDLWQTDSPPGVWVLPMEDPEKIQRLEIPEARSPLISPDGKWIAYATHTGLSQIYLQRFPELGQRYQVSVSQSRAHTPTWAKNGNLYYQEGAPAYRLMKVSIDLEDESAPIIGEPEIWIEHQFFSRADHYREYDISPEGNEILTIEADVFPLDAEPQKIVVEQNWIEELKRLAPGQTD